MFSLTTIILGCVIASFLVILYLLSLRRIVPTNEVHIVQKAGKTLTYGKESTDNLGNTYYEFPAWFPILGVDVTGFTASVFDLDLVDYEAYDKDRLPFVVDVKAFFRIDDFRLASSRVESARELENQLLGIVQGACRSILAKEDLESIMCERNKYGNMFTKEVSEQLKEWGVKAVKNIELMDIRDSKGSEVIANIMRKKKSQIEMESRVTVANNTQKAKEAEIIAQQEIDLKQQDSDRKVGLKRAEVEQEVGIAQEKAEQEVQAQARVTTEKKMEVEKVAQVRSAEIEREASVVRAEADKQVITINADANIVKADADKKVKVLNAEADKQQAELKAEADLAIATKGAEGIKAQGLAKAEAEKQMQLAPVEAQIQLAQKIGENKEYQEFIIKQKQVEVLGEVGKEQAKALVSAEIKIFATAGNASEGLNNIGNVISSKSGLDLGGMLEAFVSTPIGAEIADKVLHTNDAVKSVTTTSQMAKALSGIEYKRKTKED